MAQVFKRRGSPFFYMRVQIKGEDIVKSTKRRKKADAEAVMRQWVAELKGELSLDEQLETLLGLIAKLPDAERDQKRRDVAKRILAEQSKKIALADAWKEWRNDTNREYEPKPRTIEGYQAIWNRFKEWAEAKHIEHLHEVSIDHAESYAASLWKSGISPATYNAHTKFLRGMFKALARRAGLVENPWGESSKGTIKAKLKRTDEGRRNLTQKEIATVLKESSGDLHVMLTVGLFTGLRLGDVVNLHWSDIDEKTGFITVVPLKTKRLGKSVTIPVHPILANVLSEHKRGSKSDHLFPSVLKEYQKGQGRVTKSIQQFFRDCGIETTEKADHKHRAKAIVRVGFHSLRHSFVSLCAESKIPQTIVQELVGHGSPMMTAHYTHLSAQHKADAFKALTIDTKEHDEGDQKEAA